MKYVYIFYNCYLLKTKATGTVINKKHMSKIKQFILLISIMIVITILNESEIHTIILT